MTPRWLFADMDLYAFASEPGALGGWQAAETVNFKSTDPTKYDPCPLLFSSLTQAQATTRFAGGYLCETTVLATEAKVQILMPACTVKNLRISEDAAPPVGQTTTVTVNKNGVAMALTAQITSAGRGASDLKPEDAVTFNGTTDLLSIAVVNSATTGTKYVNISLEAFA